MIAQVKQSFLLLLVSLLSLNPDSRA